MKRRRGSSMKKWLLSSAVICLLGVGVSAHPARAGTQQPPTAECGHYEDEESSYDYCHGTMADFRNSSDPTALALFNTTSYSRYFYGRYAGKTYFCGANFYTAPLWPYTVNFLGEFYIEMNGGYCTDLGFNHTSEYGAP
jgi:hypothetical protein